MEEDHYEKELKNITDKYENLERQLDKGNKCVVVQLGSKVTRFGFAGDAVCETIETSLAYKITQEKTLAEPQLPAPVAENQSGRQDAANETSENGSPFKFPEIENVDELYAKIHSEHSLKVYEDKKMKLHIKELKPDTAFLPQQTAMKIESVEDETILFGCKSYDSDYRVVRPIYRGNLNVSESYSEERAADDLLKLTEHILYQRLKLSYQMMPEYDIVFVIPDNFNRKQYETFFDSLVKAVPFAGLSVQLESVMVSFANCLSSGVVLDVGYTKTTIVAVDEGVAIDESLVTLDFGIQNILQAYEAILAQKRNIDVSEFEPRTLAEDLLMRYGRFNYELDDEQGSEEESKAGDSGDKNNAANTPANGPTQPILRKAKVLLKRKDEEEPSEFLLNLDDMVVALNLMFAEIPDIAHLPLDQTINDAVYKIPSEELRKKLFMNLVLAGGLADLPGFSKELESAMIDRVPEEIEEVGVVESESDGMSKKESAFQGGCIVPKLDSFAEILIKRDVYLGTAAGADKRLLNGKPYLRDKVTFKW